MVLWLVGTAAATGVVFTAVNRLSSDLTSVSRQNNGAKTGTPAKSNAAVAPSTAVPTSVDVTTSPTVAPTSVPETTVAPPPTATEPLPVAEPTSDDPKIGSPATTRPSTATSPTPATTRPSATVAPPVVTAAPTTQPPPPASTEAPPPVTTSPPVTTAPSCFVDAVRVGKAGRLTYQVCPNGVSLVTPFVSPGWAYTVVAYGPPAMTVRFTQGSSVLSCTVTSEAGAVTVYGDCQ